LFFVAVLAIGFSLLADGFKQRVVQKRLEREAKELEQQFQVRKRGLPQTPVPAKTMQKVVEAVDAIQGQAASPMETMTLVSQALAGCPDIRLQKLDWKMAVDSSGGQENVEGSTVAAQPVVGGEGGKEEVPALLLGMLAGKTRVTTILDGLVYPGRGYLDAQQSVNHFIAALKEVPGMKVTPIVMPTVTSPDSSMSAILDGGEIQALFSVQLDYQLRQ
jgi:hypothetical protein